MGSWFSLLFKKRSDLRVLMIGLDNAGKTTILYQMRLGEVVETEPTIGFNVEEVNFRGLHFVVWDVGGQDKLRALWRHYYQASHAIVFVVDTSDSERIDEARDELHKMLRDPALAAVPLLVFANKSDLPNSIPGSVLSERLELKEAKGHTWFIQTSCAKTGQGIKEGMEWLANELNK